MLIDHTTTYIIREDRLCLGRVTMSSLAHQCHGFLEQAADTLIPSSEFPGHGFRVEQIVPNPHPSYIVDCRLQTLLSGFKLLVNLSVLMVHPLIPRVYELINNELTCVLESFRRAVNRVFGLFKLGSPFLKKLV